MVSSYTDRHSTAGAGERAKIKRGYVVGKVTEKLIFQATKNSKHINPLKLNKN